jgi:hypothetical protein
MHNTFTNDLDLSDRFYVLHNSHYRFKQTITHRTCEKRENLFVKDKQNRKISLSKYIK